MKVRVERAYTGTGFHVHGVPPGSVWILALRERGQVRTFRVRGDDSWNRRTASEALDLLAVELPGIARRSIRFSVQ